MTPISYATHLNEAVVADNKLASCSFPRDKLFLSHIRSLPTAMGWMCTAPAKSNPGIWVQRLSLAPRLPESVSAGLAQVQTTTRLGTKLARPKGVEGGTKRAWRGLRARSPNTIHARLPTRACVAANAGQLRIARSAMRRCTKLRIAQTGAAFNAFRPQGNTRAKRDPRCGINKTPASDHVALQTRTVRERPMRDVYKLRATGGFLTPPAHRAKPPTTVATNY